MFKYAQIHPQTGIIISISYLGESGLEETNPNLIPVDEDFNSFDKRWNGTEWEVVEPTPEPEPEPEPLTDEQLAIFDTQANVEYLVCVSELGL